MFYPFREHTLLYLESTEGKSFVFIGNIAWY